MLRRWGRSGCRISNFSSTRCGWSRFVRGMVEALHVNLGERSYPIRFGADLSADVRGEIARLAAAGCKVAVLTAKKLQRLQGDALQAMFGELPRLAIEAGESEKSLASFGRVLDFLA